MYARQHQYLFKLKQTPFLLQCDECEIIPNNMVNCDIHYVWSKKNPIKLKSNCYVIKQTMKLIIYINYV